MVAVDCCSCKRRNSFSADRAAITISFSVAAVEVVAAVEKVVAAVEVAFPVSWFSTTDCDAGVIRGRDEVKPGVKNAERLFVESEKELLFVF